MAMNGFDLGKYYFAGENIYLKVIPFEGGLINYFT